MYWFHNVFFSCRSSKYFTIYKNYTYDYVDKMKYIYNILILKMLIITRYRRKIFLFENEYYIF